MDMPWAACALGANRPMTMNTTVKTSPYSRHRPSAASPSAALEGSRKPNPNPSAAVKMMDQPLVVKSASVRPVTRALRAMGRDSSRSVSPWALRSEADPEPQCRGQDDGPAVSGEVGERAPGDEGAAGDGQGQQPVGEPLGLVLGDGDRDPAAGEQHDRGHVTGN